MAKRNQYNRRNFNQLGPLIFNQPIKFKNFNSAAARAIRLVVPAPYPSISDAIGDGGHHTRHEGNLVSNILLFTNITLDDTDAFTLTIVNSQIGPNALVLISNVCANDNGINSTIVSQGAGFMTVRLWSNNTSISSGVVFFCYTIFGAA